MTSARSSWLGPALAVALLWAPLIGLVAVWFAVKAESARSGDPSAFELASSHARLWLLVAVGFGAVELAVFGTVGVARMALGAFEGGGW
jgi:uncharacterized membrane protein